MFHQNNEQRLDTIQFGCEFPEWYLNDFLIDEDNAFVVCPDGSLKSDIIKVAFGKVFSRRRLLAADLSELIAEIKEWLEFTRKKNINHITKIIVRDLLSTVRSNILKISLDEVTLLQHFKNYLSKIVDAESVDLLLDQAGYRTDKDIISLNHEKQLTKQWHRIIKNHIQLSLSQITDEIILNSILKMKDQLSQAIQFSDDEKLMIEELQHHLTQEEMMLFLETKTKLIATNNIKYLTSYPRSRGIYLSDQSSIFIRKKYVKQSLIHEVQHSLGFDLSIARPRAYFSFYSECKEIDLSFQSGFFRMKDKAALDQYKSKKDADPIMIERAEYLFSLYLYKEIEKEQEILAHFRQFLADFGVETTKEIMPNLYEFWEKMLIKQAEKTFNFNNQESKIDDKFII